jgi:hypothetical protein
VARKSQRVQLVKLIRLGLALVCTSTAVACATPAVLQRARGTTNTDSRETVVRSVKRAGLLESGALLLCLEIRSFRREQVHVEVPLDAIGKPRERTGFDFGREKGFDGPSPDDPGSLRYVFPQEDFDEGCPDPDRPLPIYTGAKGSRGPGIYTARGQNGIGVRYLSEKPLWSSLREIEIAPVLETTEIEVEVPGKPLYYLALPFALAFDAVAALFYVGLLF